MTKKAKTEKFASFKDLGKLKKEIVHEDAQKDKQLMRHPKRANTNGKTKGCK